MDHRTSDSDFPLPGFSGPPRQLGKCLPVPVFRSPNERRGIITFIVIFVVVVLTIFLLQFHLMSRQTQATAFQQERREIHHRIAKAAAEEGFESFRRIASSPATTEGKWLKERKNTPLSLKTPMALKIAKSMARSGEEPSIEVEASIVESEFRHTTGAGKAFYGNDEGVGSVKITSKVWRHRPGGTGTTSPSCEVTQYHDYKVVSIRTARDNKASRGAYAQNFPLDYALMARKAWSEFSQETSGGSLNNTKKRLVVDQKGIPGERRGKVHLGGATKASNKYVFLNVHERFFKADGTGLVPLPTQTEVLIESTDWLDLFPALKEELESQGGNAQAVAGIKGVFRFNNAPIVRDSFSGKEKEKEAIDILSSQATGADKCIESGIEVLGEPASIGEVDPSLVIEGDVRQRYLRFVQFCLEDRANSLSAQRAADLKTKTTFTSIELKNLPTGSDDDSKWQRGFYEGLSKLVANKNLDVMSVFVASYPYKAGCSGAPDPGFPEFPFRSVSNDPVDADSPDLQPYMHVNLFGRRWDVQKTMEDRGEGVLEPDGGTINLHGIFQVYDGNLSLGAPGKTLKIRGLGVISAKGDINILGNIEKESLKDLCILFTRKGVIRIDADRVDASLVAMGGGAGRVIPKKPVTINGAVVVDKLGLRDWPEGTSYIKYDPLLKSSGDDIFVMNISPAITYERVQEGLN